MVALQAGWFFPRTARRGNAARRRCCRSKGVFSFQREYPLLIPQRKARGVPLDPRIGSRGLEELHALRNRVPAKCCCKTIWSTPTTRCRSACDSAAFSNLRLLWILSTLQVPTEATLLRSPRLFALLAEGGRTALAAVRTTENACTVDRRKLVCTDGRYAERQRIIVAEANRLAEPMAASAAMPHSAGSLPPR